MLQTAGAHRTKKPRDCGVKSGRATRRQTRRKADYAMIRRKVVYQPTPLSIHSRFDASDRSACDWRSCDGFFLTAPADRLHHFVDLRFFPVDDGIGAKQRCGRWFIAVQNPRTTLWSSTIYLRDI
jgi:hypothetical protein